MGYCVSKDKRWPEGVIIWRGASGADALKDADRENVVRALAVWEKALGGVISFRERESDDTAGCVTIKRANGSSNSAGGIGYVQAGSVFSYGVASNFSTLVHEVGHILGLFHEHERPDAPDHGLKWGAMVEMMLQGKKRERANALMPAAGTCFRGHASCSYNINSIMHYAKNAWTWQANVVAWDVPGEAEVPTEGDVATARFLYL